MKVLTLDKRECLRQRCKDSTETKLRNWDKQKLKMLILMHEIYLRQDNHYVLIKISNKIPGRISHVVYFLQMNYLLVFVISNYFILTKIA